MTLIGISFRMTERAWKYLQTKVEKDKAIQTPGIFVSSHAMKIGCKEVGGSWLSINIQDSKVRNEEFEQVGVCKKFPIFFETDALYFLREFSNLTFDLASENSGTITFRELKP